LLEKKNKRRIVAALAVLLAAAGGVLAWRVIWGGGDGPVEYETVAAERGSISSQVTASGTLSPLVTVQVGSQVSGRILELKADFNSHVEKGQIVARIDPQLFQTEVAKARANHNSARAQVTRAEAELAQANRNHDRTSSLAEQQLVARADVDSSLAASQTAQASVAASRAMLSQAKAAVEQAETNLALTTIISPISGIVISRNVDVGQTVAASLQAPTLFTIAEDLAKMEVHTSVAESDVGRLSTGMQVEFTVDAHPSERFKGAVKEVRYAPQTVQNVVTYDAVVSVDNSDLKLRPGMTADVTFMIEKREAVVVVPNTALRFRPPQKVLDQIGWKPPDERRSGRGRAAAEGSPRGQARVRGGGGSAADKGPPRERGAAGRRLVWKLGKDGVPAPTMIEIGISDGKMTEVVSGVSEGETVIVGVVGAEQPSAQPGGGGPGGNQRDRDRRRMGRFL
jgi:HlyD family secretion protein